jgi:CubicO group peptidase (beta-lactamase class C family)
MLSSMKRFSTACLTAIFSIGLLTGWSSAADLPGLGEWMEALVADGRVVGCSAQVTQGGETIFLEAYGDRTPESGDDLSADQIVRIYSMSKAITSTAVMQLVEQGELGIDDPVSRYIPEFGEMVVGLNEQARPARRLITVRDLLTHTSGLAYDFSATDEFKPVYRAAFEKTPTLETAAVAIGNLPLVCEVGSQFQYGLSTDVLGRIIEVVSGQHFGVYLQQDIFGPLGMKNTSFAPPKNTVEMPIVTGSPGSLAVDHVFYEEQRNRALQPQFESGGGGLWSTLHDYTRFMQAIEQGGTLDGTRILKPATVAFMTQNHLSPAYGTGQRFGLGFGLPEAVDTSEGPRGGSRWTWGGAACTYFFIDPVQDVTAIFITQKFPFDGPMSEEFHQVVLESLALKESHELIAK